MSENENEWHLTSLRKNSKIFMLERNFDSDDGTVWFRLVVSKITSVRFLKKEDELCFYISGFYGHEYVSELECNTNMVMSDKTLILIDSWIFCTPEIFDRFERTAVYWNVCGCRSPLGIIYKPFPDEKRKRTHRCQLIRDLTKTR